MRRHLHGGPFPRFYSFSGTLNLALGALPTPGRRETPAKNVHLFRRLSLLEAFTGAHFTLAITRDRVCAACKGTGAAGGRRAMMPCPRCFDHDVEVDDDDDDDGAGGDGSAAGKGALGSGTWAEYSRNCCPEIVVAFFEHVETFLWLTK